MTLKLWMRLCTLAVICLLCPLLPAAAVTAAPTTAASTTSAPTVSIGLGVIWDSPEAASYISSLSTQMLQRINDSCSTSARVKQTYFSIVGINLTTLPTNDEVSTIVDQLSALNFLFFGMKQNALTQILYSLHTTTTLDEYPAMQIHTVAPLPQSLLLDVLMKVIRQRVNESQYPTDPSNFKAALFMDSSVSVPDLYSLFTYFREGFIYFSYNAATLESDLLTAKYAQISTFVVIMLGADEGRNLRDVAFKLGMFSARFRWFIHGPRLVNEESLGSAVNIVSMNVTSIEFGRIDASLLAQGIWSTTGVFVYDLMSIWSPYLTNYLCNEKQPINQTISGLTGKFKLNPDGSATRLNWQMSVYTGLGVNKLQIGQWTSDGKFEMLSHSEAPRGTAEILADLQASSFRVATVISPPYVQFVDGVTNCSYPCRNELTGMYIELCKLVLNNLGISNYDFYIQPDNAFGSNNGGWNGLIKTVMDGKAMLGCAPITINTDRYKIVDFTQIVHSSRESLLFRQKTIDPITRAFQFILPLNLTIWLAVLGALLLVSLSLFVMSRIAPNSDANYNLYNSIFFTFAEVVQGTSGTMPTQISGRIVVSFFWFFTMFLFLSYIANYAVFRTLDGVKQEVTSLDTLIQSREYDCGTIANTVTDSLLQSSAYLQMQQVYLLMTETFPNGSVSSMEAAMSIINDQNRNFVLINDNLQNQYYRDMGCDLISTGEFYDLKNAMIVPKGSEYGELIDAQLSNLTLNITALQKRFFTVPESKRQSCYDGSFASAVRYYTPKDAWPIMPGALTLSDTLGIAVINLLGCCIAMALAGIERAIGRMQLYLSGSRRKRQVDRANESVFKRPNK